METENGIYTPYKNRYSMETPKSKLWREVYLSTLNRGMYHDTCIKYANEAVVAYEKVMRKF